MSMGWAYGKDDDPNEARKQKLVIIGFCLASSILGIVAWIKTHSLMFIFLGVATPWILAFLIAFIGSLFAVIISSLIDLFVWVTGHKKKSEGDS